MNIRFWKNLKSSKFQLLQTSFTPQIQLLQNDIATLHHGINACLLQTWNPRCISYKEGMPTTNPTVRAQSKGTQFWWERGMDAFFAPRKHLEAAWVS